MYIEPKIKLWRRVTFQRLLSLGPCTSPVNYRDPRVLARLSGGRKSLTPLKIAELDIPAENRMWVLLRPEILGDRNCHKLICDFAAVVLDVFEKEYPDDHRPRRAIETKRRWLAGEADDDELAEARSVAWEAAEAAWAEARAAARAAMAARAAAREKQLAMVVERLEMIR